MAFPDEQRRRGWGRVVAVAGRVAAPRERVQRRILSQPARSGVLDRSEWLDAQVRTDTLRARQRREPGER